MWIRHDGEQPCRVCGVSRGEWHKAVPPWSNRLIFRIILFQWGVVLFVALLILLSVLLGG